MTTTTTESRDRDIINNIFSAQWIAKKKRLLHTKKLGYRGSTV